jgi:hypothetical protein
MLKFARYWSWARTGGGTPVGWRRKVWTGWSLPEHFLVCFFAQNFWGCYNG